MYSLLFQLWMTAFIVSGDLLQRPVPAGSPPPHNYHAISGHDYPVGPGSGYPPPPPVGPVPGGDYRPVSDYPEVNAPLTEYGYGRQDDVNILRRPVHEL